MYTEEEKQNYINEIKDIFKYHSKSAGKMLKKREHLLSFIKEMTPKLNDKKYTISTRVFWILHNITDFPLCSSCSKPITKNVVSVKQGYSKIQNVSKIDFDLINFKKIHCSIKCAENDKEVIDKINATHEKRYGKGNSRNRKKAFETTFKHFGVKNGFQTKTSIEVRNKFNEERRKSGKIRTYFKHTYYFYDGLNFDSSPEVAYYIWLKDNKINFEYEPKNPKFYYYENDKRCRYFPDFIVEGKIIEIKGDHFFDKDGNPFCIYNNKSWKDKYEFMKSLGVIILKSKEYNKYIEYVNKTYGQNYILQFKKKVNCK